MQGSSAAVALQLLCCLVLIGLSGHVGAINFAQQIVPDDSDDIYFGSSLATRRNGYQDPVMVGAIRSIPPYAALATSMYWQVDGGYAYFFADSLPLVQTNLTLAPQPVSIALCVSVDGYHLLGSYWHVPGGAIHISDNSAGHPIVLNFTNPHPTQSQFAYKVSCSMNFETIAVYDRQLPSTSSSHVYVYNRVGLTGEWLLGTTYTFDARVNGQPLAQDVSVSADGNVVAFGYTPGAIRVCRYGDCQSISVPGEVPFSLELDNDGGRLAYGDIAWANDGYLGRAVVYEYSSIGSYYPYRTNLQYPFKTASVQQGYSIAFSGNLLFVGMPQGYNTTGAVAVWGSHTPGLWIPMPVPLVMPAIFQPGQGLGTSLAVLTNSSRLFAGAPSTTSTAPSGVVMYYNETDTWPPVLPTLPNWQAVTPPTTMGLTPSPATLPTTVRGLAVTADGAAFVAIGRLGNETTGPFYGIVYRRELQSGYYVMDAVPLVDPGSGYLGSSDQFYPACISDDSLILAIGSRLNDTSDGYVSLYSRASTGSDFTNVQVLTDPEPTGPPKIWAYNLVCTPSMSSLMAYGKTPYTLNIFSRNAVSGLWNHTYSYQNVTGDGAPVPAAMSRDGSLYTGHSEATGNSFVGIYRTSTNEMVSMVTEVPRFTINSTICSLALDYYGRRLAAGYCYNTSESSSGIGFVQIYEYSPSAEKYYYSATLSQGPEGGRFGASVSLSGGGDILAVSTPCDSAGGGFITIWQAPLGSTNWVQQLELAAFDDGVPGSTIGCDYPGILHDLLSLNGDFLITPSSNGSLVYKNVSISVMPPSPAESVYTPYQTMSGYLVPNDLSNIILYGIGQAFTGTGEFVAHAYYDADSSAIKAVVFRRNAYGNYTYYVDPFVVSSSGNEAMLTGLAPTVPMCITTDGQYVATALWWHGTLGKVIISWRNATSGSYQTIHTLTDSLQSPLRQFARDMKCPDDMQRIIVATTSNDTSDTTLPYIRAYWRNTVIPYSNWIAYWEYTVASYNSLGSILGLSGDGQVVAFWDPANNQTVTLNGFEGLVISELAAELPLQPAALALSNDGEILALGDPTYLDGTGRLLVYQSLGTPGSFDLASRVDISLPINTSGLGSSAAFCESTIGPRLVIGASSYGSTNKGMLYIRDYFNGGWLDREILTAFGFPSIISNQYLGYSDVQVSATHDCATLMAAAPCPTQTCEGFAYSWNVTISAPIGPPITPPVTPPTPVAPIAPPTQVPVTATPPPLTEQDKWSIGIAIAAVVTIAACAITLAICISGRSGTQSSSSSATKQTKKKKTYERM